MSQFLTSYQKNALIITSLNFSSDFALAELTKGIKYTS